LKLMAEMAAPRYELTIDKLLLNTLHRRSRQEIVYGKTRYDWVAFYERVRRLASGLERMGVRKGTTVAVIDVDTNRYMEAYYAIPMMGATMHTVNIRLPPEHLGYTMVHAQDEFVLIRDEFLPVATKLAGSIKSLKGVVTMSDTGSAPTVPFPNTEFYDDLLAGADPQYEFPELAEDTRATIFYTSGTTGLPKGVWFTHRQLVLHTLGTQIGLAGSFSQNRLEVRDVVMPLVPFFHVHSWGVPYGVGLNGQKTVLAGKYDPANILELIAREGVTWSNMVPTVLNMILVHPAVEKYRDALARWKVSVGGGALPREMAVRAQKLGINVMAGYGLSETAPVLTLANPQEQHIGMNREQILDTVLLKTGIPIPLVAIRVVDPEMRDVPRDGKTAGEIVVRGPWLTSEYYKEPIKTEDLWRGGWMHTGDMAVMDEEGYVTIVDRIKDAIKSGGEWIPTIILEDLLVRHPAVFEAAVIGARDQQWGERPLAVVSLRQNQSASSDDLKKHMETFVAEGKMAKFWVPDQYVILEEQLPKTSTGKIDKKPLREKYSGIVITH
jgi:acyl-CoA synthetase (AMP-forming)/AMP-acid ligase II